MFSKSFHVWVSRCTLTVEGTSITDVRSDMLQPHTRDENLDPDLHFVPHTSRSWSGMKAKGSAPEDKRHFALGHCSWANLASAWGWQLSNGRKYIKRSGNLHTSASTPTCRTSLHCLATYITTWWKKVFDYGSLLPQQWFLHHFSAT